MNYLKRVDWPFYESYVRDFLPDAAVDAHTHIYRASLLGPSEPVRNWVDYLCPKTWPLATMQRYYSRLFPDKSVKPVIFAMPKIVPDLDALNNFVAASAASGAAYPYIVTDPQWSAEELAARLRPGVFLGLKPYLTMVQGKKESEVTIFDFLPRAHLAVAQEMGLVVLLHIPRAGRLADPQNLAELHQIAVDFPRLKLIIAHVGRAYCMPNAEKGLPQLRDCSNFYYDISASMNQDVFELLLREVGPQRVIWGTDFPAVAFRATRICEDDNYVNIVRAANFSDSHLRVAAPEQRDHITFYIYEQLASLRRACENLHIDRTGVEAIFRRNIEGLLSV